MSLRRLTLRKNIFRRRLILKFREWVFKSVSKPSRHYAPLNPKKLTATPMKQVRGNKNWKRLVAFHLILAGTSTIASELNMPPTWRLQARVIAVGLPNVAGVCQVGRFHVGGAIPSNPEFLMSTGKGHVLDPERLLVAVGSNFGAVIGDSSAAPGAVLSIDPKIGLANTSSNMPNQILIVSDQIAVSRSKPDSAVQLFTTNSKEFLNRWHNHGSSTASFAAASSPRYLSINNAFGRPWIANAPHGENGAGSVAVVDPDGAPLDHAPSSEFGGVFAGAVSNRDRAPEDFSRNWLFRNLYASKSAQLTPGDLSRGALGTAFLGPSPDSSGFAVFAAATADGAIVQIHVRDGVDGLAPAGTLGNAADSNEPGVRGMAFKWNPERVLYIADPVNDRIVMLHLNDDERHFTIKRTTFIKSPALKNPIDLVAARPEIANSNFSSNTSLAGNSDLYIANRGDGSIVRLNQDGTVLARAIVEVPDLGLLGQDQIRGIAVSADAKRIWLTTAGALSNFAAHPGALIEISAFDAEGAIETNPKQLTRSISRTSISSNSGKKIFQTEFTPQTGLGPLFNARSCSSCHPGPGGMATDQSHLVQRVAHMDPVTGRVTNLVCTNSPVARRYSIREYGDASAPVANIPREANVISLRTPLPLYASARLDEIPDSEIEAQAVSKGDGIKGHTNRIVTADGKERVGRYGWKAHVATLHDMVKEAFINEIGSNSLTTVTQSDQVGAVVDFLRALDADAKH